MLARHRPGQLWYSVGMRHTLFRRLVIALSLALGAPALAQGWVVAEGGGLSGSETYMHDLFSFMVEKCGKEKPKVAIIGAVPLEKDERSSPFSNLRGG